MLQQDAGFSLGKAAQRLVQCLLSGMIVSMER